MIWYTDSLAVFYLPRPMKRLAALADQLCDGHVVLLFLPSQAPLGELLNMVEELCGDRVQMDSMYVSEKAHWPVKWLMERFDVEGDPDLPDAVQTLHHSGAFPELLILRGLDSLPEAALLDWQRFLEDWAHINRRLARRDRRAILVPVQTPHAVAVFGASREDPMLNKVWYAGWVTAREVRVLAAEMVRDHRNETSTALWGEAVWASLAGSDLDFFLWIVREMDIELPLSDLLTRLQDYAEQRGFRALAPVAAEVGEDVWTYGGKHGSTGMVASAPSFRQVWNPCGLPVDWTGTMRETTICTPHS